MGQTFVERFRNGFVSDRFVGGHAGNQPVTDDDDAEHGVRS